LHSRCCFDGVLNTLFDSHQVMYETAVMIVQHTTPSTTPRSLSTVLITGASDGIGLALARAYQARGVRVLAVGRRNHPALHAELHGDYGRVDLAQPYAAALVAAWLRQRGVARLDLLIHCAGIGTYGPVAQQSPQAIDALLDVNLRAPIGLTHALLPLLLAARGQVVFIGSVAAALPAPDYAVYGATKAALEGFARSLRLEVRQRVRVQVIHPGATRTGMHAKAGMPLTRIGWQRFPPPEQVAQLIIRAVARGAPVATLGRSNRLLRWAGRHAGPLVDWLARRRMEP
jgi:short-subunit dehydrogenase